MTLEELRNEQQFIEYMHTGVMGYKKLRDNDVDYFKDAVKRYVGDPELIAAILEIALERRKLIIQLSDKKSSIKYSELSNDPEFVEIKNKLTSNYPQLSNISCEDFLDGIRNSIAHGAVKDSFDFKGFYQLLFDAFKVSHMRDIRNSYHALIKENRDLITYEKLEALSKLQIQMRYGFKKDRSGNKTYNTYNIELGLEDLVRLLNVVSDHNLVSSTAVAFSDTGEAYLIDTRTKQVANKNILDNIKNIALSNINEDFVSFLDSEYFEDFPEDILQILKNHAEKVGLGRVCLIPNFLNNKLFNLDKTILAISLKCIDNDDKLEFDSYDIVDNVIKYSVKKRNISSEQLANTVYSAKIENVYQELLFTEIINLLERLEQKQQLQVLSVEEPIRNIADKLYGETKAFFLAESGLYAIKLLRNALVHLNYIFDPVEENVHFYALKKQEDYDKFNNNELEYRLTLTLDEIEQIRDACYSLYQKILKNEVASSVIEERKVETKPNNASSPNVAKKNSKRKR